METVRRLYSEIGNDDSENIVEAVMKMIANSFFVI